jgi:hypothetical protein
VTGFSAVRLALTRLAALGTLSRTAGEEGPAPTPPSPARGGGLGWGVVGEGRAAAVAGLLMTCAPGSALADTIAEPVALLQGLDKITARVSNFDAPVGAPVHFGTLSIRVRDCEKNPPEETPESAAFVEINEMRPGEKVARRLFSGWMFASSPALSALEHPVYDIVLLDCRAASGSPPPASGNSTGKEAR